MFSNIVKNDILFKTANVCVLKPDIKKGVVLFHRFFNSMNIYLFWILFLALWAIVPLMIIKGRVDETPKIQTSPKVKEKKKGWFN